VKESLSKKLGPLPVWAWALLAGGTVGVVILTKRAKAKAPAQGEAVPEHLSIPGIEGAGGGLGGGVNPEVKTPETAPSNNTSPGPTTATPVSEFLTTEHELLEGGWERHSPAPAASAAPAVSAALTHAKGGKPGRGGVPYRSAPFKGHAAHIYARAVPGGVGPGKNVIVLRGPAKVTHAKPGSHAPATHKPHVMAHHTPGKPKPPTKHAPARPRPKAKPKPKARR